ncbi:MAG: hypothetical protein IT279_14125 [Ignavibacteriaceae bacterium]|nr:hypothetical protein [Ignavibacteriaceae bacterium]
MKNLLIVLLLFAFAEQVLPQSAVYVKDRSSDETGRRFIYYLKEMFNTSSSFTLYSYIPKTDPVLVVEVLTMDKNDGDSRLEGTQTMYSVIWYVVSPDYNWGLYLNATMGYSGKQRIQETAVDIVANTKKIIDEINQYLNEN